MVGQFVLPDQDIRDAIRKSNIITLKADVTTYNQEAYELMGRLEHEARTIPFFALFPADNPDHPRTHSTLFTKDDMLAWFDDRVATWWKPNDVAFVHELPHTATGKINKLALREQFTDYQFPDA